MTEVSPGIGKKSIGVLKLMKMVDARNLLRPQTVAAAIFSNLNTDFKLMYGTTVEAVSHAIVYAHFPPKRILMIDSGAGANSMNSRFLKEFL
jgi:hypothetical protein